MDDGYIHRLISHPWPIPEKFGPGLQYLYVPIGEYHSHLTRGWHQVPNYSTRFEGQDYLLMSTGTLLTSIKTHQMVPELAIWVDEANVAQLSSEVEVMDEPPIRPSAA